jgi:hypothetical protein
VKWGLAEGRARGLRNTRHNITQHHHNITMADVPELANSNFSTIVESANGTPFNVESAIERNANGVILEGGGNTVGTRLL